MAIVVRLRFLRSSKIFSQAMLVGVRRLEDVFLDRLDDLHGTAPARLMNGMLRILDTPGIIAIVVPVVEPPITAIDLVLFDKAGGEGTRLDWRRLASS